MANQTSPIDRMLAWACVFDNVLIFEFDRALIVTLSCVVSLTSSDSDFMGLLGLLGIIGVVSAFQLVPVSKAWAKGNKCNGLV